MGDLKNLLEKAIHSIEQTTGMFYQEKAEEGYIQFEDTLILLEQAINEIFEYKLEDRGIGIDENHLVQVLTEALKAIEIKDTVLLSDILQFELKQIFVNILSSL